MWDPVLAWKNRPPDYARQAHHVEIEGLDYGHNGYHTICHINNELHAG